MKLGVTWWRPHDPRWQSVWQSQEFRALLEGHNWFTRHALPSISSRPIGWFDPPSGSRFYFSAWLMNSIMRRTYDNPLVADLYVLHEALHACTIDAYLEQSPDPFVALRVNEIEVSLETECWVYLREPSWVGRTFPDLWVAQPHVKEMMHQHKPDLDVPKAMLPKEHAYRSCALNTPWVVSRDAVFFGDQMYTEPQVWHARRHCTYFPHTSADQQVKKYEDMSEKWLKHVLPHVKEIQQARSCLLDDLDAYERALESHMQEGLPWGGLLPKKAMLG